MKTITIQSLIALTLISIVFASRNNNEMKNTITPPVAKKIKKELTIHNHTRTDNYYWLNDRENKEVIDYLNAENEYTNAQLKHTEKLQDELYNEIIGRIKQTDESVPYKKNGYHYYIRHEEGKEYAIYCRKKENLENTEEILFDENLAAEGMSYYQSSGPEISPNNILMAIGEDTVSRNMFSIKFINLETGEVYPERIANTTGNVAWANDNKTVFYTLQDEETLRSFKIFRHKLGTPQSEDIEVFHEQDETFGTYVYRTKSGKFILIGSYSTLQSEYQIINANNPDDKFQLFEPRGEEHEYDLYHAGNKFYIKTNWNAKNFRLMVTDDNKLSKANWKEVIPHRDDILLEDVEIFASHIVAEERINGLTNLRVINTKNNEEHYLDFGEATYTSYLGYNPEFETTKLRYGFSSFITPNSTISYDMNNKSKEILKQQEIVGGYNANDYVSERFYAVARDSVKVPISIVYKKGFNKDGNAPLLLYSYGSYGSSSEAYFNSARLSLLNRGFAVAIAHIRGGEEMGRQWYENGKLLNKKNTFFDFIDCAKHLITEKYTNPDKLCIYGGSAGGLLMGAVINYEPQLFKAVISAVPFVDVVTTMLDESIPLTTGEYDEWGNPNEIEYYDYMLSYSPYDNVEAKAYPAMLVTTGLHDSQVQYWEPAKWVAKMRELKTDNNVLLLKTNMEAGHHGASGRFETQKETAMEYAFFIDQVK